MVLFLSGLGSIAQTDSAYSIPQEQRRYRRPVFRDSLALARWQAKKDSIQRARDSIRAYQDSISIAKIKAPDPNRPNRFLDSLIAVYTVKNLDFAELSSRFPKKVQRYDQGSIRKKGQLWVILFIVLLLFFFAILRNQFTKEL